MTALSDPRIGEPMRKAIELLSDSEWHDYDATLREMMKTVPPGQARRYTERSREWKSAKVNDGKAKPRVKPRTDDQLIRTGQREICRKVLRTRGRFEFDGEPRAVQRVRISPDYLATLKKEEDGAPPHTT